jgi:hypothetical protein
VEDKDREKKLHPGDPADARFLANFANEDPGYNPMPLLCMIWSLDESEVSGPLKKLRDQVAPAMTLEEYSTSASVNWGFGNGGEWDDRG